MEQIGTLLEFVCYIFIIYYGIHIWIPYLLNCCVITLLKLNRTELEQNRTKPYIYSYDYSFSLKLELYSRKIVIQFGLRFGLISDS